MGQLKDNFLLLVDDLRTSWYFRVWGAVWGVLAIMSFVAFVILAHNSAEQSTRLNFNYWTEHVSSLEFPGFRFRVDTGSQERFNGSVKCLHNGGAIFTGPCTGIEPHSCISVRTDGLIAYNQKDVPPDNQRIKCSFQTNAVSNSMNSLVLFQLEGEKIANWGGALQDVIYFGPNQDAWILLSKSWVKFSGFYAQEEWKKVLEYHSTTHIKGQYNVQIILNSFNVHHAEQQSAYDGWMALGGSGGFAYFMVVIHVIVMMLVGIALNNDTKFLGPKDISYEPVSTQPKSPTQATSGSAENRVY